MKKRILVGVIIAILLCIGLALMCDSFSAVAEEKVEAKEEKETVKEKAAVKEDLTGKTVAELRELAKAKEVKGYSTMKKAELLEALK